MEGQERPWTTSGGGFKRPTTGSRKNLAVPNSRLVITRAATQVSCKILMNANDI